MKSSTAIEFEKKGNKIMYKVNSSIMEKIDEVISAIKKCKTEKCQEKLTKGKKIIQITDTEEDVWEVEKCYFSDNPPFQRMKRSSLELVRKQLQTKENSKPHQGTAALGITQNLTKSLLPADKKGIFSISSQNRRN